MKYNVIKTKVENNYTQIPNFLLTDKNITNSQLRLICYLLSFKESFEFSFYYLSKKLNRKQEYIKKDIELLIHYKYISIDDNRIHITFSVIEEQINNNLHPKMGSSDINLKCDLGNNIHPKMGSSDKNLKCDNTFVTGNDECSVFGIFRCSNFGINPYSDFGINSTVLCEQ